MRIIVIKESAGHLCNLRKKKGTSRYLVSGVDAEKLRVGGAA